MNLKKCSACADGIEAPFAFSMAFQPIVNLEDQSIFAYEALVRGLEGQSAYEILSQVNDNNRYSFDQSCRIKAITLATQLMMLEKDCFLSINFLPNAIYNPAACIRATLKAAEMNGFPLDHLIFEVTEGEEIEDKQHLKDIMDEYRMRGFKTAIDDFGDGYAGLNLLSEFQPDIIKIDMKLIRDIHKKPVSRAIVESIVNVCKALNITFVAEGIETVDERDILLGMGVFLQQGFLFAKPSFETLPVPTHLL